MRLQHVLTTALISIVGLPMCVASPVGYTQINLSSDIPGLAANTDPSMKNPWGISFAPTSPLWVSDQGTRLSTLYNGAGVKQGLVVSIPPDPGGGPTGQVFNTSATTVLGASPATFIFVTLSGTIEAWNAGAGTTAVIVNTTAGAAFTGLAQAGDTLYAADFAGATIRTFNSSFNPITPTGDFTVPGLPANYSPYNVQNINGQLYVEYALIDSVTHRASEDPNTGLVAVFDANGNYVKTLASQTNLSSPWGITLAPAGFGTFGGDLLVGNFGDGTINAYDPATGAFLGKISDGQGNPIANDGLWGIGFRTGGTGFQPNTLYFVAGINNEADGLFGAITPIPEPGTFVLVSILGAVMIFGRKRVRTLL